MWFGRQLLARRSADFGSDDELNELLREDAVDELFVYRTVHCDDAAESR